jgi:hypothetical protein
MGLALKLLQRTKYFSFHAMAISVKLLKELSDKVKSEKNSCPDSQATATDLKRRRTHTSPYDNGNQLTFDDGKVIW